MPKLHWISMALIAAPVALIVHCSGDDTTPGGAAGSGTSTTTAGGGGASDAGATGGGGSGGRATGGSAGTGTGGGGAGGRGGTGGGGTGGAAPDGAISDAPVVSDVAVGEGGMTMSCNDPNGYMDSGLGITCNQYCMTYFDVCNNNPAVAADAGMGVYMNPGDCMTKCRGFNQSQICCYAVHVNNAAANDGGGAVMHCKHAAGLPGNGICPLHP